MTSKYTTPAFWEGLLERAAKTAVQTVAPALAGIALQAVDWPAALGLTGSAVLLSVLTSFAFPHQTDVSVATGVDPDQLVVGPDETPPLS